MFLSNTNPPHDYLQFTLRLKFAAARQKRLMIIKNAAVGVFEHGRDNRSFRESVTTRGVKKALQQGGVKLCSNKSGNTTNSTGAVTRGTDQIIYSL